MTRAATRSIAAMGATVLLLSGAATMLASTASAASTTPPWEVGTAKDPNEVGTLALYNSSGKQVTSGSVLASPIAAYAVGSKADTTHPKATLFMYLPKSGVSASAWSGEQLSLSTPYPVKGSGVPTVVSGAKGPVVTGTAGDENIATFIGDFPNTDTSTTDGYGNAYQLRVKTSTDGPYQSLDIVVSNITTSGGVVTGGTWTETFPGALIKTTTTMKVSATKAVKGKSVTLTATTAAGSAHVAGKVQFLDNKKKLGKAVSASTSTGKATLKTTALVIGKNSITATFTPTSTKYATSTSTAKTVTVKGLKETKLPKLSGSGKVGKTEKVSKGSWSPKPSSFSYQWYLGSSKIKGATKSSYKLISKDAGKKVSVKVTVKKSGYGTSTAKSKAITVKK
jgi:Bacterial Ig-like domain (group 3)